MNALLIASFLLNAPPDVTSTDWVSVDQNHFLAFRPMQKDQNNGVVWYIDANSDSDDLSPVAFSGTYNRIRRNRVRLALTRAWQQVSDERNTVHWARDTSYRDTQGTEGGLCAIHLEIDSSPGGMVATALDPELIDVNGERESGDTAYYAERHLRPGTVLDMQPAAEHPLDVAVEPPGFVKRSRWRNRAAKQGAKTVAFTHHLKKDLYGRIFSENYDGELESRFAILALHNSGKWDNGKAWLISGPEDDDHTIYALYGSFQLYSNKLPEQDVLIVSFGATRSYQGQSTEDRISWEMDTSFDPVITNFDLPLSDHAIPVIMTLSIESMQHANKAGKAIAKYDRDGFLSLPKRYWPSWVSHLQNDETIQLQTARSRRFTSTEQAIIRRLRTSPPPGFRFRTSKDEYVVAMKPATGGSGGTSGKTNPADRAWKRGWKADKEKNYQEALLAYEAVTRRAPEFARGFNALAWLLATCPDASIRDGRRAVEFAERACELTNHENAVFLDTLAAAYAEQGDFEKAVEWQQKAVKLVSESEKAEYLEHLVLFLKNEPVREP